MSLQLFVIYQKTILIKFVDWDASIAEIKNRISEQILLPIDEQILYYMGKVLANEKTIDDYEIENNAFIYLNRKLPGGGTIDGFPDIGHLVILLGISSIILLGIYYFFSLMANTTQHLQARDCSLLQSVMDTSNKALTSSFGFSAPASPVSPQMSSISSLAKGKIKLTGGYVPSANTLYLLYNFATLFYSALIVINLTIYLYTMMCSQHLSGKVLITSLASLLIIFVFLAVFYKLTRAAKFAPWKLMTYPIMTAIFTLASVVIIILMLLNKVSYYMYLYALGVGLSYLTIYYISTFQLNNYLFILIALLVTSLGIFLPYIMAYVDNVVYHC